MKRTIALVCMMMMLSAPALAQGGYTLGGSEADVVYNLTAMPDGHMLLAGMTMSSDGTLADRTKTGQTGWLACVAAGGDTLWNFCSRQGPRDYMRAPVVHEDGTITVLLMGNGSEKNLLELIRLSAQGDVIGRKTILAFSNDEAQCLIEEPGVFSGGYVLASADLNEGFRRITYRWFDFDGKLLKTAANQWDGAVMAVGGRHIIEAHDGAYWLCSLDESGGDTRLCRLFDSDGSDYMTRMTFTSLVSMEDGGAAACMHQGQNEKSRGRMIRFNADGSVRYQLDLGSFRPDDLRRTQEGFAMTGMTGDGAYMLWWLGDEGKLLRTDALSFVYDYASCPFDVLADGSAAVACRTQGKKGAGDMVNYDVELHIETKPQ